MNKKYIIAGVVVVVLVVGGALIFGLKKDDKKTDDSANTSQSDKSDTSMKGENNNDKEEDLGACTMVDKSTIESALGASASTLQGPQNTGVTGLGDGDKGQTCVYPFAEGESVTNSFYIDIASYATQETFDDVSQYSDSGTAVSGIGDKAFYEVSEPIVTTSKEFSLTVFKDKKIIKFVISQPGDNATFTDASAQTALVSIAQAAKL